MNCTEWLGKLDDHVDGALAPEAAEAMTAHAASCPACAEELRRRRELLAAAGTLERNVFPARDLWPEIVEAIAAPARSARPVGASMSFPRWGMLAVAAALTVLAGGTFVWQRIATNPSFNVTRIEGAPRIGRASVTEGARLRVGQWLETDAGSSARVEVASIGRVTLQPNSRLRLLGTSPAEHRLELVRGSLEAFVVAPPRLFIIETPAATAIDLGCAYTIAVDERGAGLLHVTLGYVALAREGREEIVRAGMMCAMRPGIGAGTPFAADAPEGFRQALARFDFESAAALPEVLALARPLEDGATLWLLLNRVTGESRGAVFDALARGVPIPAGVTRADVLGGDPAALEALGSALGIMPR
jgi:hypothetical protein